MKRLAFTLLLLFAASAAFAQLPPLVKSALDGVDYDQDKWAYTMTTVDNGEKNVETFDPSKPEGQQWQLVIKDGRKATSSEQASYAREKQERKAKRGSQKRELNLSKMIRPGSLRMIRDTPADSSYEFRLPVEGDKDSMGREAIDTMRGRLTVVKSGPWLQTLEIDNEKPIKPVMAVRIDRMYTKMTFHAPAAGTPALLGEVKVTLRGRALYVKSLDHDSVVTYSDYRRVK